MTKVVENIWAHAGQGFLLSLHKEQYLLSILHEYESMPRMGLMCNHLETVVCQSYYSGTGLRVHVDKLFNSLKGTVVIAVTMMGF